MQGLTKFQIIALAGFLLILISIPISFSLVSQTQIFSSRASEKKTATSSAQITGTATKPRPVPTNSPLTDLQKLIQGVTDSTNPGVTPNPSTGTSDINLAFGPTLNLTVSLEGRPANKQAGQVFVGIASGNTATSPTYILTFTIDVPDSGIFKGISLAGLNPGSVYTAYLKGASQIDSASTFTMASTESNLNNNQPVSLTTGDLNEDNVINSADFTIARGYYGTTSVSGNWNVRVDFNKDNVINTYDLQYINNNMGKVGSSGTWISTPRVSTPSASINPKSAVGGPPAGFGDLLQTASPSASTSAEPDSVSNPSGYWLYIP